MREISSLIAQVLRKVDDDHIAEEVRGQAAELCSRFVPYPDLVLSKGIRITSCRAT